MVIPATDSRQSNPNNSMFDTAPETNEDQADPGSSIFDVFADNFSMVFSEEYRMEDREPGFIERLGNIGIKPWKVIPTKLLHFCTDARTVVAAATALALIGNTFGWYPAESMEYAEHVWNYLKDLPWEEILPKLRFAGWLATSELITAIGTRTFGRVNDPVIMSKEGAVAATSKVSDDADDANGDPDGPSSSSTNYSEANPSETTGAVYAATMSDDQQS